MDINYRIVESMYDYELQIEVHNMIIDGWIPTGGIMRHNQIFYQALWLPPVPEEIKIAMERIATQEAIKK